MHAVEIFTTKVVNMAVSGDRAYLAPKPLPHPIALSFPLACVSVLLGCFGVFSRPSTLIGSAHRLVGEDGRDRDVDFSSGRGGRAAAGHGGERAKGACILFFFVVVVTLDERIYQECNHTGPWCHNCAADMPCHAMPAQDARKHTRRRNDVPQAMYLLG